MLALTAQVTAMQMANQVVKARMNVMELEFKSHISAMRAELSNMQNPSFLPPMISHGNESSATAFGIRYLNGVFGPSVAPIPPSVGMGQTLVSCPSACPDMQGSTFTSGQASSASAHAGPSSAPTGI
ncbi:hypothetical protein BDR07DRAFT_1478905 [Suillus spraguei]|nr:hypothetical protein BDR07DRAFT_1478905 [Suillus spraguei]